MKKIKQEEIRKEREENEQREKEETKKRVQLEGYYRKIVIIFFSDY